MVDVSPKSQYFNHYTVMLNEAVDYLGVFDNPDAVYIDATMGGAGHSELIASRLSKKGKLFCFDVDKDAVEAGRKRLKDYQNVFINHDSYANFPKYLKEHNIDKITGGILFDLGASYHQLTSAQRGFSFTKDAKLDMRFNEESTFCAWDIVNKYSEENLVSIFSKYGEERFSKRIAKAIVSNRPINTTLQLASLIKTSTPKINSSIHPATRVFQALRIEVNKELLNFENTLNEVVTLSDAGAIICVISFHSLEDRIAKHLLKEYSKDCRCPKNVAICECSGKLIEIITKKPITASDQEVKNNPPSRSAKLRAARRV